MGGGRSPMIIVGSKRLYQSWPSNNQFECSGRLIHGPDRLYFYIAACILVGTGLCFLVFVAPELIKGDILPRGWNIAFIPVFCFLWIYAIVTHLIVAYSDPGIIPRQAPLEDVYNSPSQTKNILVNGQLFTVRWCQTCNIYRPPRAVHCGICDNCVHRFDHHCPYVGNCVGQRNYRVFLFFIFFTFLASVFGLLHSVLFLTVRISLLGISLAFYTSPLAVIFSFLIALVGLLATLMVGVLGGFTTYLVGKARTTNENIKQTFQMGNNPYDQGCGGNCFGSCCPPYYPRAINPLDFHMINV